VGSALKATKEAVTFAPGSAWIDAKAVEAAVDLSDEIELESAAQLIAGELMEGACRRRSHV
jgi:hypothetical protein